MANVNVKRKVGGRKPPPDWARAVQALREKLEWDRDQLAGRLGVTKVTIFNWEYGHRAPGIAQWIELGKLATAPDSWFFFQKAGLSKSDFYRQMAEAQGHVLSRIEGRRVEPIKVVPRDAIKGGRRKAMEVGHIAIPLLSDPAAAGSPRLIDEQIIERDVVVPAEVVPHPLDTVCIKVSGDSMSPILQEGYIIAVDAAQRDPARLIHQMVVLKELTGDDAGITIKWLDRLGREYVLTPENKAYRPEAMTRDHHLIGRVIWWHGHEPRMTAPSSDPRAVALAEYLRLEPPDVVVSSRAKETAEGAEKPIRARTSKAGGRGRR